MKKDESNYDREEKKTLIDKVSQMQDTHEIEMDPNTGEALSVLMLKVDISKGYWGENRFYLA